MPALAHVGEVRSVSREPLAESLDLAFAEARRARDASRESPGVDFGLARDDVLDRQLLRDRLGEEWVE